LIGSLEEGKSADIVLVDLSHPHLQPVNDPISHLVYSAQGLEVDTVLCEGRILLEKKNFRTLKAAPVYKKAATWRKKIAVNLKKLK
jgi:5-methylthioadenosine/S-adenosylhomocysteine deaminase